jgi:hypothetical protein
MRPANAVAERTIKLFSRGHRNLVRGLVAEARRGPLTQKQIDSIRGGAAELDMIAAAAILDGPGGLRERQVTGLRQGDVGAPHSLTPRHYMLEAAYTSGLLNSWKPEAIVAVETIEVLSRLTEVDQKDALRALSRLATAWGASNYLALKLSFAKEWFALTEADENIIDHIDRIVDHDKNPSLQYSAMENINTRISLFAVARRHTNTLLDRVNGDFRRFHNLNNLVGTPISQEDCAGFILRASETTLLDTVRAVLIIFNLRDRLPDVVDAFTRNLDPDILSSLLACREALTNSEHPLLIADQPDGEAEKSDGRHSEDRSMALYRRSLAFLEFPTLCTFRHDIDRVIGHRLIAPLLPEISSWHSDTYNDLNTLRKGDGQFHIFQHGTDSIQLDLFYRTYLFLRFIQDPHNLSTLSAEDVTFIFNNTTRLEMLLLERELKTMHLNASDEARALISVLALALYRGKSSDPDIDFDFRATLEQYIIRNFNSSITEFIDELVSASPGIANYIVSSLDEVTLQKLYQIIDNPVAAENARKDILTTVGVHLNKLEYIIEAEGIETRSKVSKLKNYFDTSRMFVDSVSMKKWLGSNPSAYTQQYKELLPKITARLLSSNVSVGDTKLEIIEITSTDALLVERMSTEAFREFCANNEFGIESYLGRRIRHNTLQGVMTKSVDAVVQRQEYQPIIAGTPFGQALQAWESSYKIFIERMRREFLQFKSESRPNGLFNSAIDTSDPITKRNLQQLVHTLRFSGAEMLDELIITFCWRQIAPQLEFASRQIRVKMSQEMTQSLDHALQRFNGPEELKIKTALQDGLSSVFAQVAGWFQVPQTGFVPASIPEICNIIDIESGRTLSPTVVNGTGVGTIYYGISVHRLYDCLAVLLQNAFKHGRPGNDVTVRMNSVPIPGTNLHSIDIAVRSVLPEKGHHRCVDRLTEALTSSETGRDMVNEGYSGIKKVKFITRLNEGDPTVSFDLLDDIVEVRFRLKVEVAEDGAP